MDIESDTEAVEVLEGVEVIPPFQVVRPIDLSGSGNNDTMVLVKRQSSIGADDPFYPREGKALTWKHVNMTVVSTKIYLECQNHPFFMQQCLINLLSC